MLNAVEMRASYRDVSSWVERSTRAGLEAIEGARNFAANLNLRGLEAARHRRNSHYERLTAEVAKGDTPKHLVDLLI